MARKERYLSSYTSSPKDYLDDWEERFRHTWGSRQTSGDQVGKSVVSMLPVAGPLASIGMTFGRKSGALPSFKKTGRFWESDRNFHGMGPRAASYRKRAGGFAPIKRSQSFDATTSDKKIAKQMKKAGGDDPWNWGMDFGVPLASAVVGGLGMYAQGAGEAARAGNIAAESAQATPIVMDGASALTTDAATLLGPEIMDFAAGIGQSAPVVADSAPSISQMIANLGEPVSALDKVAKAGYLADQAKTAKTIHKVAKIARNFGKAIAKNKANEEEEETGFGTQYTGVG